MPTISIYQFHARNISVTIANVYHVSKRNSYFFRRKIFIYPRIIYIKDTFLYSEEELRFAGVIDNLCWPNCNTTIIIVERTCVNFFKCTFLCHFCAFNHFLKSWRNNIVLHNYIVLFPVCADSLKPVLHTIKQFDFWAVFCQYFLVEYHHTLRFLNHFPHIRKVIIHIVCAC